MSDYLFDKIDILNRKILELEDIFLFLDYDGTLVDFKDKPEEVTTPENIKKVIKQLIKNPKSMVIIVTGRTLKDIKKLLRIRGLSYIALHGLNIDRTNELKCSWDQADKTRLLIKAIKRDMQHNLGDEKGVFLEDKELTLVLHYRLVTTNKIKIIVDKFKKVVKTLDKKKILEIINGAKIIEARPKGWHKGKAIEMFLADHLKKKNTLPIYIGDDITDEDAFRYLKKRGITIFVENKSKRKTNARYFVRNPDEVFSFLTYLSHILNQ